MEQSSPKPANDAERYRTLLGISNALVANLTREDLFGAIATALRRVVPFERTAVFLHDPQRRVLRLPPVRTRKNRDRSQHLGPVPPPHGGILS